MTVAASGMGVVVEGVGGGGRSGGRLRSSLEVVRDIMSKRL